MQSSTLLGATPSIGDLVLPQKSAAIMWMDGRNGIVSSGGLVDSWTSRIGAAVFTQSGAARPTVGAGYVEGNGTSQFLARACDASSWPAGSAQGTFLAWTYPISYPGGFRVPVTWQPDSSIQTSGLSTYYTVQGNVDLGYDEVLVAAPLGAWYCEAIVFDGSLPAVDRIRVYRGATPSTVALATPTGGSVNPSSTVLAAASGQSRILARKPGEELYWHGRVAQVLAWSAALTLSEIQLAASLTQPT